MMNPMAQTARTEKLVPYDIDAEEAVLGSILLDGDEAMPHLASLLTPSDFYREVNGQVFTACLSLYNRGVGIDQITVAQELASQGQLEAVGGAACLLHLIGSVPTPYHAAHYGRLVSRLSTLRRLIEAGGLIAKLGFDAGTEPGEAISKGMDILAGIQPVQQELVTSKQLAGELLEWVLHKQEVKEPSGLSYGWPSVDGVAGLMQPGDFILLGARPSVGKTTILQQVATYNASPSPWVKGGRVVCMVSAEMPRLALGLWHLARETGIDARRLRQEELTQGEIDQLHGAISNLATLPIIWFDSHNITPSAIYRKVKQVQAWSEGKLSLVVVDYLGLLKAEKGENRTQEVSSISNALKNMAKASGVPFLVASQLSRAVEYRTGQDRRPRLSDLRDTGSLEQDADTVLFLYRPEASWTEEEWVEQFPDEPYRRGEIDILLAKDRFYGHLGQTTLFWDEPHKGYRSRTL